MNNDINDNFSLNTGVTQKTITKTDEFLNTDLATLINRYGEKKLFEEIFGYDKNHYSVTDEIKSRQQQIIALLWSSGQRINLTLLQRRQVIDVLASIDPTMNIDQLTNNLQQINPNLTANGVIDLNETIGRSRLIKQAFDNLEILILNHFCYDYLLNVLYFYKLDETTIIDYEKQIIEIGDELADQLENFLKNDFKIDELLIKKSVDFLGKLGRTKLFLAEEQKEKNLGQLTDIYSQLIFAIKVTKNLKIKQIQTSNNLEQIAINEIKLLLKNDIEI